MTITKHILLGLTLFLLGMVGVLSMLTMETPLPEEMKALLESKFSPDQIKLLLLINPSVILLITVVLGTIGFGKTFLRAPLIERLIGIGKEQIDFVGVLKFGALGGVVAGILLAGISLLFHPMLPESFAALESSIQPTLAVRFLYGGITEEVMMRFGLMTLIVWLASKVVKGHMAAWIGIVIAALLFAVGHFPVAFQAVGDPSLELLAYILLGNAVGGIIFGWLYWKKGLESAMIAHMVAHVFLVLV